MKVSSRLHFQKCAGKFKYTVLSITINTVIMQLCNKTVFTSWPLTRFESFHHTSNDLLNALKTLRLVLLQMTRLHRVTLDKK